MKVSVTQFFKYLISLLIIVMGSLGFLIWKASQPPKSGGNFNLIYRNQEWRFSDNPKKLNLLYFGYAKCPDIIVGLIIAVLFLKSAWPILIESIKAIRQPDVKHTHP